MQRWSTIFFAIAACLGWANPSHAQSPAPLILQPNGSSAAAPAGADANADAWPDDPFATLADHELWLAATAERTVAALRWSAGDEMIQTIDLEVPRPGDTNLHIFLEAPGALAAPGEIAVLLLAIAPDVESLGGAGVQPAEFSARRALPGNFHPHQRRQRRHLRRDRPCARRRNAAEPAH